MAAALLGAMSTCAGTAYADGPLDQVPAGGLIIERREGLSIDAEELRIGPSGVHVSYLFANHGTRDLRTKVAFSVPPLPVCDSKHVADSFYRRDFAKDPNPMQFKVFVDGAAKPFSTDERTRMHGGVGSRRLTHHWSQVFPKDRPVRIVYEYIPVAGRAGSDPFSDEELRGLERWFREDYCVPINVVRALLERMFSFRIVHYTLTAEPSEIRSFKLTIETKSPDELVSTCIPDLRRTSPTTLEVERRNFRPKDDLKIWFLPAGQLSASAPAPPAPAAPPLSSDSSCPIRATAITVGQSHACALVSDGSVWCWGANYVGQLGDGTTTFRSAPVPVAGLHDALAIAAGARHTCALRRLDNEVVCWGANEAGQVGRPPRPFAGFMGTFEPALKPSEVSNMVDVRMIAAGDAYTMAVKIRGEVYFWGALPEYAGQKDATRGPEKVWPERGWEYRGKKPWETATRIAAGANLGCFWTRDGASCFGPDLHWLGQKAEYRFDPVRLEGANNLDPFAIGHGNVCGVDAGGTLHCWGQAEPVGGNARSSASQPFGRSVTVSGLAKVVRIASGGHTCAVVANGRAACWGPNSYGQLGDGTTTRQLNPVWVAGLSDAADVAVGDTNTCVRTRDGHVLCWGENGYGQLGDGTTESRMHPTQTQFCSRAPASIFPEPPPGQQLIAALQRSQCHGACPVYSVRVYADGSVIYRGDTFVRVRGGRKGRLTGAEIAALRAAFRDARFLEMPYRCGKAATDSPTARLYYTDGRKARLISNYHGCTEAPRRLAELENEVDRILGTNRWVGNTGREEFAPDVEAFEPPLSVLGVKTEDQ